MENFRKVLSSKKLWLNCILSLCVNFFSASFVLSKLKDLSLLSYWIIGLVLISTIIVGINFLLLLPINWIFNKTTKLKNKVYEYYSALILLPCLTFYTKLDVGFEAVACSIIVVLLLYLLEAKDELKKIKTWVYLLLVGVFSSVILFFACGLNIYLSTYFVIHLSRFKEAIF